MAEDPEAYLLAFRAVLRQGVPAEALGAVLALLVLFADGFPVSWVINPIDFLVFNLQLLGTTLLVLRCLPAAATRAANSGAKDAREAQPDLEQNARRPALQKFDELEADDFVVYLRQAMQS